jgi:hypothetical protein
VLGRARAVLLSVGTISFALQYFFDFGESVPGMNDDRWPPLVIEIVTVTRLVFMHKR